MATSLCPETPSTMEVIQHRHDVSVSLLQSVQKLKSRSVCGIERVEKKIKAEKGFLESLLSCSTKLKKQHLVSSNLPNLEAVVHACEHAPGVSAVQETFCYQATDGSFRSSLVDVVANEGGTWVRVFARNRQALRRAWMGDGRYGDRSVVDLAHDILRAAQQNPHLFQPPRIVMAFFDGITGSIAAELTLLGVSVVGPEFNDECDDITPSCDDITPSPLGVAKMLSEVLGGGGIKKSVEETLKLEAPLCVIDDRINLDVSTMLAWVSSLTHGGAHHHFPEPILNDQALQEQLDPLWPKLQSETRGKVLMACETAVRSFQSILMVVGGKQERDRGRLLLSRVEVVEDAPSSRAVALAVSGKIKPRAKVVFGTGDSLKAVTLTANGAFVRAAAHQGVVFSVILHSSRALTEAKEPPEPSSALQDRTPAVFPLSETDTVQGHCSSVEQPGNETRSIQPETSLHGTDLHGCLTVQSDTVTPT